MKRLRLLSLSLLVASISVGVIAAPVTNTDIEKLLAAGMSEGVILNVINGGEHQFDTSSDALIALKDKGATPAILAAMTGPVPPPPPVALPVQQTPATLPSGAQSISHARAEMEMMVKSNDVIFVDGVKRTTMSYSTANMRMAGLMVSVIAFGFGQRSYWSISGQHAQFRSGNPNPIVIVSVARNSHPEQSVTLTRWEPRSGGTREIMIDRSKLVGDSVTFQGPEFPRERVIPIEFASAKDEASGEVLPDRYQMRSKIPLTPGEYAVIVMHQVFDFGIDQPK